MGAEDEQRRSSSFEFLSSHSDLTVPSSVTQPNRGSQLVSSIRDRPLSNKLPFPEEEEPVPHSPDNHALLRLDMAFVASDLDVASGSMSGPQSAFSDSDSDYGSDDARRGGSGGGRAGDMRRHHHHHHHSYVRNHNHVDQRGSGARYGYYSYYSHHGQHYNHSYNHDHAQARKSAGSGTSAFTKGLKAIKATMSIANLKAKSRGSASAESAASATSTTSRRPKRHLHSPSVSSSVSASTSSHPSPLGYAPSPLSSPVTTQSCLASADAFSVSGTTSASHSHSSSIASSSMGYQSSSITSFSHHEAPCAPPDMPLPPLPTEGVLTPPPPPPPTMMKYHHQQHHPSSVILAAHTTTYNTTTTTTTTTTNTTATATGSPAAVYTPSLMEIEVDGSRYRMPTSADPDTSMARLEMSMEKLRYYKPPSAAPSPVIAVAADGVPFPEGQPSPVPMTPALAAQPQSESLQVPRELRRKASRERERRSLQVDTSSKITPEAIVVAVTAAADTPATTANEPLETSAPAHITEWRFPTRKEAELPSSAPLPPLAAPSPQLPSGSPRPCEPVPVSAPPLLPSYSPSSFRRPPSFQLLPLFDFEQRPGRTLSPIDIRASRQLRHSRQLRRTSSLLELSDLREALKLSLSSDSLSQFSALDALRQPSRDDIDVPEHSTAIPVVEPQAVTAIPTPSLSPEQVQKPPVPPRNTPSLSFSPPKIGLSPKRSVPFIHRPIRSECMSDRSPHMPTVVKQRTQPSSRQSHDAVAPPAPAEAEATTFSRGRRPTFVSPLKTQLRLRNLSRASDIWASGSSTQQSPPEDAETSPNSKGSLTRKFLDRVGMYSEKRHRARSSVAVHE